MKRDGGLRSPAGGLDYAALRQMQARPRLQASAVLVIRVYKWNDAGSEQAVRVAPIAALPIGERTRSRAAPG
jgi:hypothetical protein